MSPSSASLRPNSLIPFLFIITAAKIFLSFHWGHTADIDIMRASAETFLSGRDIFDPANTLKSPVHLPIGHHLIVGAALLMERAAGVPFSFAIKLPAVFSDLFVALLLRTESRQGNRASLIYMLNPVTFLLSVYHGQLHSVAAAGAFAAAALAIRGHAGAGGLLLGLASSIRQHFLLIALPLLPLRTPARSSVRFLSALAATLVVVNAALLRYDGADRLSGPISSYGMWGYTMLLLQGPRVLELYGVSRMGDSFASLNGALRGAGSSMNLVWIAAFSLLTLARTRRGAVDPWRWILLYLLGLYVFAPGIGVQWLIWALPFWIVVDPRAAAVYSGAAGTFIGGSYWQWTLNKKYGVYSMTANLRLLEPWELGGMMFVAAAGLLTWLLVAKTAAAIAAHPREHTA